MRVTPYGMDERYAQKLDGPNYYIGGLFVELCGGQAMRQTKATWQMKNSVGLEIRMEKRRVEEIHLAGDLKDIFARKTGDFYCNCLSGLSVVREPCAV